MARGSKSKYTAKQKRMAEHIEEGYEHRGVGEKTAAARAWATVNKVTGGGRKGGSGHKSDNKEPMRKGGRRSHSSSRTKSRSHSGHSSSSKRGSSSKSRSSRGHSSRGHSSRKRSSSRSSGRSRSSSH